jgi:hypothetical protein
MRWDKQPAQHFAGSNVLWRALGSGALLENVPPGNCFSLCTPVHILEMCCMSGTQTKPDSTWKSMASILPMRRVFEDESALTLRDPFAEEEERWITVF